MVCQQENIFKHVFYNYLGSSLVSFTDPSEFLKNHVCVQAHVYFSLKKLLLSLDSPRGPTYNGKDLITALIQNSSFGLREGPPPPQEDIASPWLSFSPAPHGVESKDTDPGCSNAQLARHCQLGTLDRPEIYI